MRIRTNCKFGMFTVHAHDRNVWAEVNGKLYAWNPDATGIVGGIQHSGNFLSGDERRDPAQGGGDWVQYPHLEHGHVVTTAGLWHLSNQYPGWDEVQAALAGNAPYRKWETTNQAPGKNDEWIPLELLQA